jgi:hypothetical protein
VNGKRLAIVTNGIGPGVLAADSAYTNGVELAKLSDATMELLNNALPRNWSHGNPIDLIGDASPVRFRTAVKACIDDPNVDGVLVIFTPQAGTDHLTTAQLMIGLQRESSKPMFLSWLGDAKVSESRDLFSKAKCAHFRALNTALKCSATLRLISTTSNCCCRRLDRWKASVRHRTCCVPGRSLPARWLRADYFVRTGIQRSTGCLPHSGQSHPAGSYGRRGRGAGRANSLPSRAENRLTGHHLQVRCGWGGTQYQ